MIPIEVRQQLYEDLNIRLGEAIVRRQRLKDREIILVIAYPNTYANLSSVAAGLTCNGSAGNTTPNTTFRTGYKVYRFTAGTGAISW